MDNNVAWSDAGVYKCNAGNERGNDSASDVLKVTGKILIQYLPILSPDENTRGRLHEKRKELVYTRYIYMYTAEGDINTYLSFGLNWGIILYYYSII
jgi:hypothetical protein